MSQQEINQRICEIFEDSVEARVSPSNNLVNAAILIAKSEAGEE
jgi:hypothetical protein